MSLLLVHAELERAVRSGPGIRRLGPLPLKIPMPAPERAAVGQPAALRAGFVAEVAQPFAPSTHLPRREAPFA